MKGGSGCVSSQSGVTLMPCPVKCSQVTESPIWTVTFSGSSSIVGAMTCLCTVTVTSPAQTTDGPASTKAPISTALKTSRRIIVYPYPTIGCSLSVLLSLRCHKLFRLLRRPGRGLECSDLLVLLG